jgi:hypothetical protein
MAIERSPRGPRRFGILFLLGPLVAACGETATERPTTRQGRT